MRGPNWSGKEKTRPEGTSCGRSTKSYGAKPEIAVRQTDGKKGLSLQPKSRLHQKINYKTTDSSAGTSYSEIPSISHSY